MDKKKTILVAVLINAGLLLVLFIAALTSQEDLPKEAAPLATQPVVPFPVEEAALPPLDLTGHCPASTLESPPIQEAVLVLNEETPPIHKLPPLAHEEISLVSAPTPAPVSPLQPTTAPSSSFSEITVKKGDSLEKIAKAHHTTVDEIIKLNHLPSSFLKVGQVLKLPEERKMTAAPKLKPPAPLEKTGGAEYYTVKVGDNPWTIAMKHHLKVDQLLQLNGLNEEKARKLKPGDRLRIR